MLQGEASKQRGERIARGRELLGLERSRPFCCELALFFLRLPVLTVLELELPRRQDVGAGSIVDWFQGTGNPFHRYNTRVQHSALPELGRGRLSGRFPGHAGTCSS